MLGNIQALRVLAALAVVIFHFRPIVDPLTFERLRSGQAGVDIFFVISGFIIAYTTRERRMSAGEFYFRRLIRILPLYWSLTLVIAAASQFAPGILSGGAVTWDELVRSLLFIPYVHDGEMQPVIFLGWTLNYEMFFYSLFGLALWLGGGRSPVALVCAPLLLLVAAGAVLRPDPVSVAGFYTSPLLLEFVAGMLLSSLYLRLPPALGARTRALALAAMGLGLALIAASFLWPGVERVVKWGLPAVAVVGGALALERAGARLSWPWLMTLGEASYAAYLIHPFLIKPGIFVMQALGGGLAAKAVFVVLTLAATGIGAVMLLLLFEKPVMDRLKGMRAEHARRRAPPPPEDAAREQA